MRLDPLTADELPDELKPVLEFSRQTMGFTANDVLTMARWPALLMAMQPVVGVIYGPGELDMGLKRLIAIVVSGAAGCGYCQAHAGHGASLVPGLSEEKIGAVWAFETSDHFDERERAALRLARGAGSVPNGVTDAQFADLREHFSEQQILEMLGIVSLFGFLNRWNDTLATELERIPLNFALDNFPDDSWTPGKHEPGGK
jgi:uncharacterized peroxidase-related enzyme